MQSLGGQRRAVCNCEAEAASASSASASSASASSSSGGGAAGTRAGGAWGDGVHYCPCIATKLDNDPEMRFRRALLATLERKEAAHFAGEAAADASAGATAGVGAGGDGGGGGGGEGLPMRPPPLCCGHRKPCKRALSAARKSENRAYWKCGEPTAGCKFFKWCEPQEGDTRAGHKRTTYERGAWGLGSTHGHEAAHVHGFEPLELYEFGFEDLKADDELVKVALEVNMARGKTGNLNASLLRQSLKAMADDAVVAIDNDRYTYLSAKRMVNPLLRQALLPVMPTPSSSSSSSSSSPQQAAPPQIQTVQDMRRSVEELDMRVKKWGESRLAVALKYACVHWNRIA